MNLLVTGAASLLGQALLSGLPPGVSARAVDKELPNAISNVELMAGDLRDDAFLERALDGISHIVHLSPLYTRFGNDTATLENATKASYQLAIAARKRNVERIILGSTLDLFADLWVRYQVDEGWRTRPQPTVGQLSPYLAELTVREVTRETGVPTFCLRFGHVVDDSMVADSPADPRWLHVNDAVAAVWKALEVEASGWQVLHISAAGDQAAVPNARSALEPFSFEPAHQFLGPDDGFPEFAAPLPEPMPSRPIRRVVIFGAGGPLGSAATEALKNDYELRLADIRPVEEAVAAKPQFPGAPLPVAPEAPHEWRIMDMRSAEQVMDACDGMDAIINCAVLRQSPDSAFGVNSIGAYHVMEAAVAHGIRRVVHTGPYLTSQKGAAGYQWDDWIVDDTPARPGIDWVYQPSKFIAKEIVRIYAEYYGLVVPALAYVHLRNPGIEVQFPDVPPGWRISPFSVSWSDAALSVKAALEVKSLPSPFEFFHIGAELPHGVYPMDKAKRLLGWEATDFFEDLYSR